MGAKKPTTGKPGKLAKLTPRRARKSKGDSGKSESAKGDRAKATAPRRVLLVEDDAVLAMALEDALRDGGSSEITVCSSMSATMAALEKNNFDALVIDVHLADRNDGWALAELVSLLGTKRPRIAFSTGSPDDIPLEVAEMGPVFEKPYDPALLVAELSEGTRTGLIARLRRAIG